MGDGLSAAVETGSSRFSPDEFFYKYFGVSMRFRSVSVYYNISSASDVCTACPEAGLASKGRQGIGISTIPSSLGFGARRRDACASQVPVSRGEWS